MDGFLRLMSSSWSNKIITLLQLQNEKRRLEKDLEEIKKQKEEQEQENQKLRDDVASLR